MQITPRIVDKLHAKVLELVNERIQQINLSSIEKLAITSHITSIFAGNSNLDDAFFGITEHLQTSTNFYDIIPEIEKLYEQIKQKQLN